MHPIIAEDIAMILAAPLPWERFAGKTVLVSGGAGFLPAYIIETLLALNRRQSPSHVIALVRDRGRAEARFTGDRPTLLIQDVSSPLPTELRADFVVHAASLSSPKYFGRDPLGTIAANVDGTKNLLELARRSGSAGFLFLSSSEVYGSVAPDQVPTREDTFGPLDPTDRRACYAESKRLGETLCACYAQQYGVPTRIVRPYHTYGPGMSLDDGRVFADFVADVVAKRPIIIRSAGTATRAFCYLADAVVGFFTALLLGTDGTAYNVGDDRGEISIRELAELLVATFPERRLEVRCESRPADDRYMTSVVSRSCPDISRMRTLGWSPTTGLAEGFRRTVSTYL